jgi:hypothetical protein
MKKHRLGVFENEVLRCKLDLEDRKWQLWVESHNDELHDLHSAPDIIIMIKYKTRTWMGHVARMGMWEIHTKF